MGEFSVKAGKFWGSQTGYRRQVLLGKILTEPLVSCFVGVV